MASDFRVEIRIHRTESCVEKVVRLAYLSAATAANTKRRTKVNFVGRMFMLRDRDRLTCFFLISTRTSVCTRIGGQGRKDEHQYETGCFHDTNLY